MQTPASTPVVRVDLDFGALARAGVSAAEALEEVQAAYQGVTAGQLYREDRTLEVAVTASPELRRDPEAVGDLLVRGAGGAVAPLRDLAHVYLSESRTLVSHEGGRPREVVTANPKPADAAHVTRQAQSEAGGPRPTAGGLPRGVRHGPGRERRAPGARRQHGPGARGRGGAPARRLPFGREVVLILVSTPFALVGGVAAVALTGGSMSLGSLVGFITLFGVAARNAILLVAHLEHLIAVEGREWSAQTVVLAARERVTPILMTAVVTALGVLPLAVAKWSGRPGDPGGRWRL